MEMQQGLRINAAPLTAAVVLAAALGFGGVVGYAIGTSVRAPLSLPAPQNVMTQSPEYVVPSRWHVAPVEGSPEATLYGDAIPTFEVGRMCTADFKFCREPQNSYD